MSDTKKGEYAKQNRSYQDKLIPSSSKSFIENVYAQMLKKSGRRFPTTHFDAKRECERVNQVRPEYTGTFKQEEPRYKAGL